jgi:TonB-dependent SusC/RagA subfamily outer membrane receptor
MNYKTSIRIVLSALVVCTQALLAVSVSGRAADGKSKMAHVSDCLQLYAQETRSQTPGKKNSQNDPIVILDGKIVSSEVLHQISRSSIECFWILRNGQAKELYGDAAANGVMIIKTKAEVDKPDPQQPLAIEPTPDYRTRQGDAHETSQTTRVRTSGDELLLIVDGKESENFNQIIPENIESITVLKSPASVNMYGEKARNGVIVIVTKKNN